MGRPSKYNITLANKICEAIATSTKGLKTLCEENDDFPSYRVLRSWISDNKVFQHLYEIAKTDQAEYMADEMLEIADDSSNDYMQNKEGFIELKTENIQRSRLRIDTRKWIASKLKPKKFGEKVDVTSDNKPLNIEPITSIKIIYSNNK
jgi:hypothetical protein